VTDAIARDFTDRFLQYDSNQVSFLEDTYSVDEDLDGEVDFTFGDPDFALFNFVPTWSFDGNTYLGLKSFWFGRKMYQGQETLPMDSSPI